MTRIVFGTEELEPTASNFKRAWEMYAAPAMMSDAKLVFDAYEAQLAEKDKRIAELEAENAELTKHKPEKIADRCPSCGIRGLFVGTGGLLTCSNVECENPCVSNAIAALKPKFEVGQEVEVEIRGKWMPAQVSALRAVITVRTNFSNDGTRFQEFDVKDSRIRLPQPKVTKPTADEWYEAFCGEQNGDFKEMVKLARRHEATQREVAK